MQRLLRTILSVTLCLGAGPSLSDDPNLGKAMSTTSHARNDPAVEGGVVFDSDIAAVETAWGEPIPGHLIRIGGLDEWSWAAVEMTVVDGEMEFSGEYRNHKLRYVGQFQRVGGREEIAPETIFDRYVMSHIDGTDLVMREIGVPPPRDYFVLRPAEPDRIDVAPD